MFKSISYFHLYKSNHILYDDEFEEEFVAMSATEVMSKIISIYKKRNLNVPANIVKYIQYSTEGQVFSDAKYYLHLLKINHIDICNDVQKYMFLI